MFHRNAAFALLSSAAMLLAVPAFAQDKAEIYKLMPNSALSGVIDPEMADRSDIAKALPTEKRNPDDKLVIGWTEITLGNPWFVAVIDTAKAKAAEYGYELDVQVADGDPAKTSAHIDAFIAKVTDEIKNRTYNA